MQMVGKSQYRLTTQCKFDAPLGAVWDAILRVEAWPNWWTGIERVVTLEQGNLSGLGWRRRCTCKSVLPYRLTFVTRVTRLEPLRLVEVQVDGQLEGNGYCHLARSGEFTVVRYDWHVRTTQWWMNLLAPLAKPIFRWNHDAIMLAGGAGLERHLRLTRIASGEK